MNAQTPMLSLATPEAMTCPFGVYDEMRAESAAYKDAVTGFYVVTRYADIRAVTADPGTFSSKMDTRMFSSDAADEIERMYNGAGFPRTETLVSLDPPKHGDLRTLVDKVFSPKRVREAEPQIISIVEDLIAEFPQASFDFCTMFAVPLPVRMIADQIGLPADRLDDFKRWSDESVNAVQMGRSREAQIQGANTTLEMRRYFRDAIHAARAHPTGSLLSDLANARTSTGELLGANEIGLLLQLLLAAGNETTTHATGSAMLRIAKDAELQSRLRADPGQIPRFIEEVLRLDSPLQGLFRTATKDTFIGDVPVPAGAMINIRFAAGNRDAAQFERPCELNLARPQPAHLAFGSGVHFCIGSQLARAEMKLAFEHLLRASTQIRVAEIENAVAHDPHFVTYGPKRLMLDFQR